MKSLNVKKIFLYLLIGSIALSALMGIWAILSSEFGDTQEKILLTTLTVVGTSILGLACGSYLESPRAQNSPLKIVPGAGIILALLAALSAFLLIWRIYDFDDKGITKVFALSLMWAFSLAQLSLLSLARLASRFQWSLVAAYIVIAFLDSIVSGIIIFELTGDDGLILRLIGVLSVLAAALTVMIPIFHRLSRADFTGDEILSVEKIDAELATLHRRITSLEKQREDIINKDEG